MDSSTTRTFVGRQSEMGILRSAFEDVVSGWGRIVLLVGELGIGKTRTCQELCSYAIGRGARVLWARCFEEIGPAPYWPWVQALQSYVRDCPETKLNSALGLDATVVAEVVPEIREKLPGLRPPPTSTDPEQGRLRLFDSITSFFRRTAQTQPVVLVFDNLQWSDRSSLLLLEFVAEYMADARILILGTYRDRELAWGRALQRTLGGLVRLPYFQRLSLTGLTETEVGAYIELVCGRLPQHSLVREIHRRTAGNPLFLVELVRLLEQQEVLGEEDPTGRADLAIGIPQGVKEAIRRRLDRLSPGCNHVLTIASVVGRQFGVSELEKLVDSLSSEQLLDVLDEAQAAGIVEELPGPFTRYWFTHVLIQETLSSELSSVRRGRLHARIAEALEELWQDDLDSHASELAAHFAHAQATLGPEKVVKYSLIAGEKALATYAYEETLVYLERAVAAKGDRVMDVQMAELLFGLGRAQGATGKVQQAWENLGRAFDYYVQEGDVLRAIKTAEYPLFFVPGVSKATRFTAQALKLVPPDSLEAGRLLSRYGLLLNLETADYVGARQALSKALAIARWERDVPLEIRILANAADVHWYHLNWPEVLVNSRQAIELARDMGESREVWPFCLAANVLWMTGRPGEASQYADDMLKEARRLRNRGFLANALLQNAVVNHIRGNWQVARDFYDCGLEAAPDFYLILGFRAQLEYDVGNFVEGKAYLDQVFEVAHATPPGVTGERFYAALLPPLVARITRVASRFDLTEEAARTLSFSPHVTPLVALDVRHGVALLAVHNRDPAVAQEQYEVLRPMAGTLLPGLMASDRLLGLLACTEGDVGRGSSRFEGALAFCRQAGYRPELAWTCHDYAEALLNFNPSEGGERAAALIEEGLAIAEELSMTPVVNRLASLQSQMKSIAAAPAYPRNLTSREVEVLRLMAAGRSNKEIAEELIISLHTVNFHVKNIFSKTDAANRAEASAFAAHHGLV